MKKVLSVLFIIVAVLTFSFFVFAEPEEPITPPSSEDSSVPSPPEDVTPPESSQEPQPDTSEESSSVQEPSESEDSSFEESVSQDTSSSENPPSAPVISNTPSQAQSSAQTTSSQEEESSQESQNATVKTKIYASDELIIISGNENAFSEDTVLKVNSITDGSEYLNASLALANTAVRFTLYSFTNENGEQPAEKLSVNFSIPALYDMDKVAIYKIGDNATATKLNHKLNKKSAKVTAQIDSLGSFAIVELFEPVSNQENSLSQQTKKEVFVIICAAGLLALATVTTAVLTIINKRK